MSHYGHFNQLTVAAALGITPLLAALQAVENGATDQHYYDLLEHHWDIVARCEEAFARWGITGIALNQPLQQLSGGMKTRLFLSGIDIFEPAIVLLDEPTNHLDAKARTQLYEWMEHTSCTLLLTSHDRQLLRLCNPIWELARRHQGLWRQLRLLCSTKEIETSARQNASGAPRKSSERSQTKTAGSSGTQTTCRCPGPQERHGERTSEGSNQRAENRCRRQYRQIEIYTATR